MLFSSSTFALADTQKVDAEHLRAHRIYEEKNLTRQRFKLEPQLGESIYPKNYLAPGELPTPEKNSNSRPPFNFDEYKGTYFFGQYQLNQSGIPLQPSNYGIFKCKPSLSKSWKEYKSNGVKEGIDGDEGGYEATPVFDLNDPLAKEEPNKLHHAYSGMINPKRTKRVLKKKNLKQPEISLKTESLIVLGPYYREQTPRSNVSGCYQNQEWDVFPKFGDEKNNSLPYLDFDHSSAKPPPPPMLKTISKERRSGDSP